MDDFKKQLLLALLAYATQRGIDAQRLCKLSALNYEDLLQNTPFDLDCQQMNNLWKNAIYLSGDNLFGLHFGESMRLAALGLVGQLIQSSNTVGEALAHAGAVIPFVTDDFEMKIEQEAAFFTVHFVPDLSKEAEHPQKFKQTADFLMAFLLHELDGLVLKIIKPKQITLIKSVEFVPEYTRLLRCENIKKGATFSLTFENDFLTLPIISANYELQSFLLQKIGGLLRGGETSENQPFGTRVYNYLMTNSFLNVLSQEAIAANFNVSVRTFQRKLKDEGVSFGQVVEDVRKTLAINYLQSGNYPIKDIAYMLGYNEASAFVRAFKRWTGKTPTEFHKT